MPFVPRSTFEVAVVWTMRRAPSQASQMRRRDFITALGAAATWPLAARAQQPAKMKRIAYVSPATKVSEISVSGRPYFRAFFEELTRVMLLAPHRHQVRRSHRSIHCWHGRAAAPYRASGLVHWGKSGSRDCVTRLPSLFFAGSAPLVKASSPDHLVKNRLISSKNRPVAGSCFRK